MSQSYRKTPISGITTCQSEKQDKRLANRIDRRSIKQVLAINPLEYTHLDRRSFRFNNVWAFGKDGKLYYGNLRYSNPHYYKILNRK